MVFEAHGWPVPECPATTWHAMMPMPGAEALVTEKNCVFFTQQLLHFITSFHPIEASEAEGPPSSNMDSVGVNTPSFADQEAELLSVSHVISISDQVLFSAAPAISRIESLLSLKQGLEQLEADLGKPSFGDDLESPLQALSPAAVQTHGTPNPKFPLISASPPSFECGVYVSARTGMEETPGFEA